MLDTWLAMAIVAVAYMSMFGIGELARRRSGARAALTRRFGHVAAGGIALALPLLFATPEPVLLLAASFVVFLIVTLRAGWLGSIHGIERRSAGAFLYPVAVATVFVFAAGDYPRYAIAVLALGVGDAVGGIVGSRWGGHPYLALGQAKTWEGSLAVFITLVALCAAILLLDGRSIADAVLTGLFVAAVVSLVEGALPWGLDNLGVPLAALLALEAGGPAWSAWSAGVLLGAAALFVIAIALPRRPRAALASRAE